jgi:hypothetical protein
MDQASGIVSDGLRVDAVCDRTIGLGEHAHPTPARHLAEPGQDPATCDGRKLE